jgi:hypothetical protein
MGKVIFNRKPMSRLVFKNFLFYRTVNYNHHFWKPFVDGSQKYCQYFRINQKMIIHKSSHHRLFTKNNFAPFILKKLTQIWQYNLCTYFRDTVVFLKMPNISRKHSRKKLIRRFQKKRQTDVIFSRIDIYCRFFWKCLICFFLICNNLLTFKGNTYFLNGFCITEKMISGVFNNLVYFTDYFYHQALHRDFTETSNARKINTNVKKINCQEFSFL